MASWAGLVDLAWLGPRGLRFEHTDQAVDNARHRQKIQVLGLIQIRMVEGVTKPARISDHHGRVIEGPEGRVIGAPDSWHPRVVVR